MKFRTEYKPTKASFTLNPEHHVVMLGSCFADNMRRKMRECLWRAENPLGTLYNPLSIERAIRMCLNPGEHNEAFYDTVFKDAEGVYHSWLFHSQLSTKGRDEMSGRFFAMKRTLFSELRTAPVLFVTFGTSYCYFLAENPDFVVANCHKQPSAMFARRRLTIGEIADCWEKLVNNLKDFNPDMRIVFTVSPVRHIKDGLEGNSRSKAVLLLAIDELCSRMDCCSYFPAYEIVNDDLRDYRFYASDLVHPSDQAVEYLWEIFRATYLNAEGEALLKEGNSIVKAYFHRPLIDDDYENYLRRLKVTERYNNFIALHPDMLEIDNV